MTSHPEDLRRPSTLPAESFEIQLARLRAGAHACVTYISLAEHVRITVSYFLAALDHGARCVYVNDPLIAEEVLLALRTHGVDANAVVDRGALLLVTSRESYVVDGHVDPDALLRLFLAVADEARTQGFSGVRLVGNPDWALGDDIERERFLQFEARFNDVASASGIAGICLYDHQRAQPGMLIDMLRAHPLAIISEQIHDNPYYDPTVQMEDSVDLERQRVDRMLSQLQARTRRETAIANLAQAALVGRQPADLLQAAADWIASELGVALVQIFELLPAGDAVRLVVSLGLHQTVTGTAEAIEPASLLASDSLRAGHPLIIPDWSQETRFRQPEVLRAAGIVTSASVAISNGHAEHPYGIVSVHTVEPHIVSDNELAFLETVATLLAHAIGRLRSEASIRALVDTAPDLIVRFDRDLGLAHVNPAVERAVGRLSVMLLGGTSREVGVTSDSMATWEITLGQVFQTGREQAVEVMLATTSGERLFEARLTPELGPDGTVASVLCVARDVTDRKLADEERERLYRELMEREGRLHEMVEQILLDQTVRRRRARGAEAMQQLTEREREILRLLADGNTNQRIGEALGLSAGTVRNHITRLLRKLGASDRTQAALRAVAWGLLD